MAEFDRPYTTSYQSAIVSIVSCTILSYLALKNIMTLKFKLGLWSLKMAPFDRPHTSSIVTMATSFKR